ncbi:MAG: response regulator transcription factor [Dehalococcoidia bacterium]|nr:response regulator transcription factor [Dehalococcoidia bacterium]
MRTKPLVIAVDDEPGILRLLKIELVSQGIDVMACASGDEALRLIEQESPDLVVLDVVMPHMNGLEVLRQIRERFHTRVVLLTAQGSDAHKVEGLDLGADDYMAKPFNPEELTARIQAILRRQPSASSHNVLHVCDGLTIDLDHRLVRRGPEIIAFTRTEWLLLEALAEHADQLVPHQRLIARIDRDDSPVDQQSLRMWISRLRRKLSGGAANSCIRTVTGVGYVLDTDDHAAHPSEDADAAPTSAW